MLFTLLWQQETVDLWYSSYVHHMHRPHLHLLMCARMLQYDSRPCIKLYAIINCCPFQSREQAILSYHYNKVNTTRMTPGCITLGSGWNLWWPNLVATWTLMVQRCGPHAKNDEKHHGIRVKCQKKAENKRKSWNVRTQENFQKKKKREISWKEELSHP